MKKNIKHKKMNIGTVLMLLGIFLMIIVFLISPGKPASASGIPTVEIWDISQRSPTVDVVCQQKPTIVVTNFQEDEEICLRIVSDESSITVMCFGHTYPDTKERIVSGLGNIRGFGHLILKPGVTYSLQGYKDGTEDVVFSVKFRFSEELCIQSQNRWYTNKVLVS